MVKFIADMMQIEYLMTLKSTPHDSDTEDYILFKAWLNTSSNNFQE